MQKVFYKLVSHLMVWAFVAFVAIAVVMLAQGGWLWASGAAVGAAVMSWAILHGTLDAVQGLGPVYWTMRTSGPGTRLVRLNFMKEIEAPYREGRGLQFRISRWRTLQIGFCHRMPFAEDVEVVGRWMDEALVSDIQTWTDEEAS